MNMVRNFCLLLVALLAAVCLPVSAIKIIHGPYLQDVREDEATLVWVTDSVSTGWVELAPNDGQHFQAMPHPKYFDTRIGIKTIGRIHSVRLTHLQPGTTYRYRVCSQEVLKHKGATVYYGVTDYTDVEGTPLHFTTLDTKKSETKFLVLNDIHARNNVLNKLLTIGQVQQQDMVFFNGDMVSYMGSEKQFFSGFLDSAVVRFASEIPLYYVRGNHETRGPYAEKFHDYVCPRHDNIYFAFQQGPVFFICLDTGEDKPDTDMAYYGITDYDNYRSQQVEWLRQVMASDAYRNARYHVVICHIPPYDNEGNWHGNNEVRDKFVPVLNEGDIDLMIGAHTHRFIYRDADSQRHFPLLVNSNNSCVTATVNGDGLRVEVHELNGKVSFSHTFGTP